MADARRVAAMLNATRKRCGGWPIATRSNCAGCGLAKPLPYAANVTDSPPRWLLVVRGLWHADVGSGLTIVALRALAKPINRGVVEPSANTDCRFTGPEIQST